MQAADGEGVGLLNLYAPEAQERIQFAIQSSQYTLNSRRYHDCVVSMVFRVE